MCTLPPSGSPQRLVGELVCHGSSKPRRDCRALRLLEQQDRQEMGLLDVVGYESACDIYQVLKPELYVWARWESMNVWHVPR